MCSSEPRIPTLVAAKLLGGAAVAALAVLAACHAVPADIGGAAPNAVALTGDLPRTGNLTRATLQELPQAEIDFEHDGVVRRYRGVHVGAILHHFGFEEGRSQRDVPAAEKRAGWRKVVVATGADGYQAAFSCAELCIEMGCSTVLLAFEVDGGPLSEGEGPFRLVVATDRKGARGVRRLARLEVIDLRRGP